MRTFSQPRRRTSSPWETLRGLLGGCLGLVLAQSAWAAPTGAPASDPADPPPTTLSPPAEAPGTPEAAPAAVTVPDYTSSSDVELTELGARWDELDAPERKALLKEVKMRMAKRKDADGRLMIRTERRYGRIVRDGRYLRIETKVVRVQPADPATGQGAFGVGFERRTSGGAAEPDPSAAFDKETPPVVRVADPAR